MSKDRPFFKLYTTKFVMDMAHLNPHEFKNRMMSAVTSWVDDKFDDAPEWLTLAKADADRLSRKQSENRNRKGKTTVNHGEPTKTTVNHGEPTKTTVNHGLSPLLSSSLPLNTEVVNTNTTTLKDSSTLSRERTPLSPVGEKEEPRPVPAWVQEHMALERGENLKAEIDRLISARGIYGTRMTVTQALGVAKARQGYDESIALALLPTRAVYERKRGLKTPMKLETLLENGGWAVDWEERLGQEMPEVDEDGFTREEIDNAF